jgi:hypothetical protein
MGGFDNRLYVVPGLDLVAVRQGGWAFEQAPTLSTFDAAFWQALGAAVPAEKGG